MAYVTPTTRADGYVVDATEYNKNTVDNVIALRTGAIAIASQATGDVVTATSATQFGRVAPATAGHALVSNGAGIAPSFQAIPLRYTEETTTATGGQNNYDLDAASTLLRCTGAAPSFTGFTVLTAAPTAGDQVVLECLGTTLHLAHQSASSTEANRIICESTTGQIVGAGGRILCIYDGTTDRWRATVLDPGTPITPTFAAGDFTATGGGSWTVAAGDVATFSYQQRGKAVHLWFHINTTTVAGTVTSLNMTLPNSWALTKAGSARIGRGVDNSSALDMYMQWAAAATAISILTYAGANFTAATDTTYVSGEVSFEVN
jgi:hypothetical protein